MLAFVDFVVYFTDDRHGSAFLIGPLLLCLSYVTAGFLIRYEFRRSVNSSGFVFCFWILSAACSSLLFVSTFRTRYSEFHRLDTARKATLTATTGLVILQLVLHLFADNACLTSRELFGERVARGRTGWGTMQSQSDDSAAGGPSRQPAEDEDDESTPVLYSLGGGAVGDGATASGGEQSSLLADGHRASMPGVPRVSTRKPCGDLLASFLSRVTFAWFTG